MGSDSNLTHKMTNFTVSEIKQMYKNAKGEGEEKRACMKDGYLTKLCYTGRGCIFNYTGPDFLF